MLFPHIYVELRPDIDWSNFVVGLITAIGTLVALWFAFRQTKEARGLAREALVREHDARKEAIEREDAFRLVELNRGKQELLTARAEKQAVDFEAVAKWREPTDTDGGWETESFISNHSSSPVYEVVVFMVTESIYDEAGTPPGFRPPVIPTPAEVETFPRLAGGENVSLVSHVFTDNSYGWRLPSPALTVYFTDIYGCRWRLMPDRHLFLESMRTVADKSAENLPETAAV